MKLTPPLRSFLLACGSMLAASSLHGADVTWDTAPGTVGVGNGTVTGGVGEWNITNGNWTTDGGANNVAWDNLNNDTAIFGGTAGTVTLGADVTVGGLTFNTTNYSIAAGAGPYKITLGAATELNANYASNNNSMSAINVEIVGSSTITKTGTGFLRLDAISDNFTGNIVVSGGTLQIGNNNTAARLGGATYAGDIDLDGGTLLLKNSETQEFSGIISGTGNLNKGGSGILTLSGDNTYTGTTSILGSGAGGPGLSVSSFNSVNETETGAVMASSSLGAPTTVANGTIYFGSSGNQRSSTLIYTGAGEETNRVMAIGFNTPNKHTISNTGSGLLKFTSNFTINPSSGSTTGGLTLRGSGDGDIAQMGTIPGILEKADGGTWAIGGTNGANSVTVTGGTLINNGTFNVTTSVAISNGATLSVGYITAESATLNATSNTIMGLGGTVRGTEYDNITLEAAGALVYGGNLNIVNDGSYDMDASLFTYELFTINGASISNSFASVTVNSISLDNSDGIWTGSNGGVDYVFNQSLGTLSVIPEPSVALLAGLGMLGFLRRRR